MEDQGHDEAQLNVQMFYYYLKFRIRVLTNLAPFLQDTLIYQNFFLRKKNYLLCFDTGYLHVDILSTEDFLSTRLIYLTARL